MRNNVLYVDDDELIVQLMQHQLGKHGYKLTTYHHAAEALDFARSNRKCINLVVTDLSMPSMSGLDLAEAIRQIEPSLPIILATAHPSADVLAAARRISNTFVTDKCAPISELLKVIDECLQKRRRGTPPIRVCDRGLPRSSWA